MELSRNIWNVWGVGAGVGLGWVGFVWGRPANGKRWQGHALEVVAGGGLHGEWARDGRLVLEVACAVWSRSAKKQPETSKRMRGAKVRAGGVLYRRHRGEAPTPKASQVAGRSEGSGGASGGRPWTQQRAN